MQRCQCCFIWHNKHQTAVTWEATVENWGNSSSWHRPWCLTVADSSMFFQREKNFIFTSILGSGLQRGNTEQLKTWHITLELLVNVLYLQKRLVSLQSVQFHLDTLLHVGIQNLLKLKERQKHLLADGQSLKHFTHYNLLPTVQNWPNLFWEATLRPFSRVVILVSYFSWPSTEANTGLGIPGSGLEREILGYPPPLLYFL